MRDLHLLYTGYYCDISYWDRYGALAICISQDTMFDRGLFNGVIFSAQWIGLDDDIEKHWTRLETSHLESAWTEMSVIQKSAFTCILGYQFHFHYIPASISVGSRNIVIYLLICIISTNYHWLQMVVTTTSTICSIRSK
jgi:hypothetical protein